VVEAGDGTVFSITPSGTETMLYSFNGGSRDGEYPEAAIINVMRRLYGTTYYGGSAHCPQPYSPDFGCGPIFSMKL
jgi:hypothetical protein